MSTAVRCARPHFLPDHDLSVCLNTPNKCSSGPYVSSKVVATLGPASHDVEVLVDLLRAGVSVARVDLTWGDLAYHMRSLNNLNEAMKRCHKLCAIMVDVIGREVMVRRAFVQDASGWPVHQDQLLVSRDEVLVLAPDPEHPDVALVTKAQALHSGHPPRVLPITSDSLPGRVQQGDALYLGRYLACGAPEQGSLYLSVTQVTPAYIKCTALNQAELSGLLTVFHPERSEHGLENAQTDSPVLSEYDQACLRVLASQFEIDFLGLSYTRSASDVKRAAEFLAEIGLKDTKVVAKLETRQALFNFRHILNSCHGVVVSRGLLGLDVAPEKMALVQKSLVTACNLAGKPVIITRVLDSMSELPRPTRAEATDVANIVLDGADGVMLGAETLRGKFPREAVRTAVSICRSAEAVFDHKNHYDFLMEAAMAAAGDVDNIMPLALRVMSPPAPPVWPTQQPATGLPSPLSSVWPGSGLIGHELTSLDGGNGGHVLLGAGKAGVLPLHSVSIRDHPSFLGVPITPATTYVKTDQHVLAPSSPPGSTSTLPSPPHTAPDSFRVAPGSGAAVTSSPPGIQVSGPGAGRVGSALAEGIADDVMEGRLRPAALPTAGGAAHVDATAHTARGLANGPTPVSPPAAGVHDHHQVADGLAGEHAGAALPLPGTVGTQLSSIEQAVEAMLVARGVLPPHHLPAGNSSNSSMTDMASGHGSVAALPVVLGMSKLESIASSAVRAAEKVKASLIVVLCHTSNAPQLLAKYRPPMPILTLVVPQLVSDGLKWKLEGRSEARQCLMVRGLLPMLSAPSPSADQVLEEAVGCAARWGLVTAHQFVVVVERMHENFAIKIVSVDDLGRGLKQGFMEAGPAGSMTPRAVTRRLTTASPHTTTRCMVPATPMVGRTLSMMDRPGSAFAAPGLTSPHPGLPRSPHISSSFWEASSLHPRSRQNTADSQAVFGGHTGSVHGSGLVSTMSDAYAVHFAGGRQDGDDPLLRSGSLLRPSVDEGPEPEAAGGAGYHVLPVRPSAHTCTRAARPGRYSPGVPPPTVMEGEADPPAADQEPHRRRSDGNKPVAGKGLLSTGLTASGSPPAKASSRESALAVNLALSSPAAGAQAAKRLFNTPGPATPFLTKTGPAPTATPPHSGYSSSSSTAFGSTADLSSVTAPTSRDQTSSGSSTARQLHATPPPVIKAGGDARGGSAPAHAVSHLTHTTPFITAQPPSVLPPDQLSAQLPGAAATGSAVSSRRDSLDLPSNASATPSPARIGGDVAGGDVAQAVAVSAELSDLGGTPAVGPGGQQLATSAPGGVLLDETPTATAAAAAIGFQVVDQSKVVVRIPSFSQGMSESGPAAEAQTRHSSLEAPTIIIPDPDADASPFEDAVEYLSRSTSPVSTSPSTYLPLATAFPSRPATEAPTPGMFGTAAGGAGLMALQAPLEGDEVEMPGTVPVLGMFDQLHTRSASTSTADEDRTLSEGLRYPWTDSLREEVQAAAEEEASVLGALSLRPGGIARSPRATSPPPPPPTHLDTAPAEGRAATAAAAAPHAQLSVGASGLDQRDVTESAGAELGAMQLAPSVTSSSESVFQEAGSEAGDKSSPVTFEVQPVCGGDGSEVGYVVCPVFPGSPVLRDEQAEGFDSGASNAELVLEQQVQGVRDESVHTLDRPPVSGNLSGADGDEKRGQAGGQAGGQEEAGQEEEAGEALDGFLESEEVDDERVGPCWFGSPRRNKPPRGGASAGLSSDSVASSPAPAAL